MNCRRVLPSFAGMLIVALLAGCQTADKPKDYAPLVARFFLEAKPTETGVALPLPVSGVSVTVNPKPIIVEYDIVNAEVAKVDLGACLMLQLTPAATRDFYRLSVSNIGRRLVLSLNDSPVGARRIEQATADGVVLIFVELPDAELPEIVGRLKRTSLDIARAAAKKK
ncbi:hypothetical protein [Oleiharenicola lentus]|uniref:hypothetical protein n=1 Tax=Oleiharenicola lentus TaxID=2508720 RepID=UPI003F674989